MRIRRSNRLSGAATALLLFSCFSCASTSQPPLMPGHPEKWETIARHRVESASGEKLGLLLEVANAGQNRRFIVLNSFGQEIGFVDGNGRAFRYRLSDGAPEHIATGTMIENIRTILRVEGALFLVAQP